MTDSEVFVLDVLVQTRCYHDIFAGKLKPIVRLHTVDDGNISTYASSLGRISGALKPSGKYSKSVQAVCTSRLTNSFETQILHLLLKLLAGVSMHLESLLKRDFAVDDRLQGRLQCVNELNGS
jgi:ABC-type dipeptide/oligopeptide/nickel transport system permease component